MDTDDGCVESARSCRRSKIWVMDGRVEDNWRRIQYYKRSVRKSILAEKMKSSLCICWEPTMMDFICGLFSSHGIRESIGTKDMPDETIML